MYTRALRGYELALGYEPVLRYLPALNAIENIGHLYSKQGKSINAKAKYSIALSRLQRVLGPTNTRFIQLITKIQALAVDGRCLSRPRQQAV